MRKLPEVVEEKEIAIAQILRDPLLQQRVGGKDQDYIDEITEKLESVQTKDDIIHPFDPVSVVWDGEWYHLWDGFSRTESYENANIPAINAKIAYGTKDDARLLSYGANPAHGMRRTRADKRNAVNKAIADPELAGASVEEIAEICNVSRQFVYSIRNEVGNGIMPDTTPKVHIKAETGYKTGSEVAKQQQYSESDLNKEIEVQTGQSQDAWLENVPAFAAILLSGGEIAPEARQMAEVWKTLKAQGIWKFLKSKRQFLKGATLHNPVIDAFRELDDIPDIDKWGVCPECRGSGYSLMDNASCSKCTGGVVLTGGLNPTMRV